MRARALEFGVRAGAVALCLALPLCALPARAEMRLDVQTDRTTLSIEDTLTLQITVHAQGTASPRVQLPQFDGFQIVSQQVQRPMQFSFSFGAQTTVQSSVIYTFVLQPLRAGVIILKPVTAELDGKTQTSRPLPITVTGNASAAPPQDNTQSGQPNPNANPSGAAPRGNAIDSSEIDPIAFLRTVVDKPEPYEGDQVTATIYLYIRERLQSTPNVVTEPTTDGLWVHDLMPPGRTLQATRQIVGNEVYAVYVLRRFAAFPLRSGDVSIGAMTLEIDTSSLFDIFAPDRAKPNLKRSSQPVVLHVKPLPEAGKPQGEIAVGRFALSAKLDRAQAVAGDAVTLTAIVQGQGNIRSIRLDNPQIKGVDVLQPEMKDLVEAPNDLVGGTREYRFLLVPREPGRVRVPQLTLASFDPAKQRYERLTAPALEFDVVGHAVAPSQAAADAKPGGEAADKAEPGEAPHKWAEIRTQSGLARGYARLVERPAFGYALGLPPLVWLAAVSALGLRRRWKARGETGSLRIMREAERRLRNAAQAANEGAAQRFYAEASAALLLVLEARLGESVAGLLRAQLGEQLRAHGMDASLAREVVAALERSELVRFSSMPPAAAELDAHARELESIWKRIANFSPRGAEAAA